MATLQEATVKELMDALIEKCNSQYSHAITMRGEWQMPFGLTSKEPISLGVLNGGRFTPALQIGVKQGLPIGKYLIGLFIVPAKDSDKPVIVSGA